jgi:hypothetical protein
LEQKCSKTQISIYPQKVQHVDQFLMKRGHRTLFKVQAAKCMNIMAVEKYYMYHVKGSLLLRTILLQYILIYECIKDTNKALTSTQFF